MWVAIQRFLGSTIGKIGAFTIKGIHVVVVGVVVAAGAGVGAYAVVEHLAASGQARTVVVTINGVNTGIDGSCHYSGRTFDQIDAGLVKEGFTNPYANGCPSNTSGGSDSLRDIAEFSYADSPGQMNNGHWTPTKFSACAPNTNSLDKDVQNLKTLLDAYSAVHPDAHFELVGHSLGGLVALQGATDYVADHGRAIITKVITLDSPLQGRSTGNRVTRNTGAEIVSHFLNVEGKCSSPPADATLGYTLDAMAHGNQDNAQTEEIVLAAHGVEVYTLGNLDDCLYAHAACAPALAKQMDHGLGGILGGVIGGGAELAGLLLVPGATNTQFVTGAFQRQYHLGQSGVWPGGHGAILSNQASVSDIAWLLAHAPGATLFVSLPAHANPLLHVFVTAPENGIQTVALQITSSSGKIIQQLTLNGAGATTYTDTLTLDPSKLGTGVFTITITSVTDNQNRSHLPQTPSTSDDTVHHDFVASASVTER